MYQASGLADFSWEAAEAEIQALSGCLGLNIAHQAVDHHAAGSRRDHIALLCLDRQGGGEALSYAELAAQSSRFANVLKALGVGLGERVFVLSERGPELYVSALGTWKARAVFAPLFAAFGPEPLCQRLVLGEAKVLVTTERLYAKKVAQIRSRVPSLDHVLLWRDRPAELPAGCLDFDALLAAADESFRIEATEPEDPAILHFTSGTTGTPKGAMHVHQAVVAHHVTARQVFDFRPDDLYWCTADPGWVTGTSYGIVAPLSHGVTSLVYAGEFEAERWYQLLAEHRVTVWYTAPTAIRMLMRAGTELARRYDLSALRVVASVGEPLNPEAVVWGQQALGLTILDNWWQTETGSIMIANRPGQPVRPGSMGKALPGVEAAIVRRRADGGVEELEPETVGELALRPSFPSLFRGYLHQEERYWRSFANGWYLSGDLARRDADGYFWFVGRSDDVIKSMGHLIGPFEVESVLLEHPAVAEAAVIGKPEPVAGEIVKAFVALKPGYLADPALELELLAFARRRLGASVAPKELALVADLPRTRSGKLMRRLLKAREQGLPEGDLSTLEGAA